MRGTRERFFSVLAVAGIAVALAMAPFPAGAASDGFSPESRQLLIIENVSRNFKKHIERIIFSSSFIDVNQRETLNKLTEWVNKNEYQRLPEFLDALTHEDAEALFASFENGHSTSSSKEIPVIESQDKTGQETVLTFPFRGEFFVAQGNTSWISHKKDTSNEFAWDFVIQKDGGMVFGNSGKNENYYAWEKPVLAAAPGVVRKIRNDEEDHPPLTTDLNKSNFVMIDHLDGEISNIHHLKKGSITVSEGTRVERGRELGRIGDSGVSMFPHIHYELDRGSVDEKKPAPAVFACYFARHKDEFSHRLVISGAPREGEYVMSVDDYLDMYYSK